MHCRGRARACAAATTTAAAAAAVPTAAAAATVTARAAVTSVAPICSRRTRSRRCLGCCCCCLGLRCVFALSTTPSLLACTPAVLAVISGAACLLQSSDAVGCLLLPRAWPRQATQAHDRCNWVDAAQYITDRAKADACCTTRRQHGSHECGTTLGSNVHVCSACLWWRRRWLKQLLMEGGRWLVQVSGSRVVTRVSPCLTSAAAATHCPRMRRSAKVATV